MRATIILAGLLMALVAGIVMMNRGAATADTCSDACDRAYAACTKSCKSNTNCFTSCLNERGSCLSKCR